MTNIPSFRYLIQVVLVLITSCIPPVQGPPPDPRSFDQTDTDLFDLGESLPYFTDFMYALRKTNLSHLMEEEGPYTVFAPVQASFSIFRNKNMINHLDEFPEDKLADILQYHFIHGDWTLADIPGGYHATLLHEKTTGNPIDLFIDKPDVFLINGLNTIDEPDLATINGYIQSIKTILEIPDLLDHLSNNKEFSLISELLERSDIDPRISDHLSDEDPVTFLAPTNKAIESFLGAYPDWQTVHDIPSQYLNDILRNHLIINRNIVLNDIKGDLILTSEYGQDFTIHIDYPEWSVMGQSKNLANLTIRDIQAANGIIQQIDRVLSPE